MEDVTVLGDSISECADVVVLLSGGSSNGARALQAPGDDLETNLLGLLGVHAGGKGAVGGGKEEVDGRSNVVDALLTVAGQVGRRGIARVAAIALVQKHGLLAKLLVGLEPVDKVIVKETLQVDILRLDLGLDKSVNDLLSIQLLGVVALERHLDLGSLELGCVLQAKSLGQLDVLLEGHGSATGVVEVGAPGQRAVQVGLGGDGASVEAVHLGAERLELLERDVAGAALGGRRLAVLGRGKGRRALGIELGDVDNVGSGVQVAVAVAANQLAVLGEGDIALENAGAHTRTSHVGLERVLGELQACAAAMRNHPRRHLHLILLAGVELALERALLEVVDEVVWARAKLDVLDGLDGAAVIRLARRGSDLADNRQAGENGDAIAVHSERDEAKEA